MNLYTEEQVINAFNTGGLNAIRDLKNRENPKGEQRPVLSLKNFMMETHPEFVLTPSELEALQKVRTPEGEAL